MASFANGDGKGDNRVSISHLAVKMCLGVLCLGVLSFLASWELVASLVAAQFTSLLLYCRPVWSTTSHMMRV